jgi:hypothetical protein
MIKMRSYIYREQFETEEEFVKACEAEEAKLKRQGYRIIEDETEWGSVAIITHICELNIIQMGLLFEIRDYLKAINAGVWTKNKGEK